MSNKQLIMHSVGLLIVLMVIINGYTYLAVTRHINPYIESSMIVLLTIALFGECSWLVHIMEKGRK